MNPGERHAQFFALIPAYLSDQLTAAKSAEAALHFQQCTECAAELHYVRQLHQYFQRQHEAVKIWGNTDTSQEVEANWLSPDRAQKNFDQLWSRIEYGAATTTKASRRRWLPVAAAAALLLAISLPLYKNVWHQNALAPQYRTLADSDALVACGQLRIRFVDNFSTAAMQSLLQAVDAHIVDGPTPHGVYTLRTSKPAAAVMQKLHLHPAVALVEPTDC